MPAITVADLLLLAGTIGGGGGQGGDGSDDGRCAAGARAGGGGQLHVDDDALDLHRLVGDVDDLAAGEVVLVVAALGVEPVDVLGRVTIGAVVLQHFAGVVAVIAEVDGEADGGAVDGFRAEALARRGDLALHGRVDDHLAGVGSDDVEVFDRAGRVVHLQATGDVLLLDGEAGGGVDGDLHGGLLHTRGGCRLALLVAGGEREGGDGDEGEAGKGAGAVHDDVLHL
jgi:hypothetical protein